MTAASGRGTVVGVVVLLIFSLMPMASAEALLGSASEAEPLLVGREVRTVETADLGLPEPTGVTYDSARGEFLVWASTDAGSTILRMDRYRNSRGLGRLPNPTTLSSMLGEPDSAGILSPSSAQGLDGIVAVNSSDGLNYVLDADGDLLSAVDAAGETISSYDLTSVGLTSPEDMTFAPSTDNTDDPDIVNLFVADSGGELTAGGLTEITLEQPVLLAATVEAAGLIQVIETSQWSPPSSDPAGIVWDPSLDQLIVADSEIEEIALFANVNMWFTRRTGSVIRRGATYGSLSAGSYSDEPTGLGYDDATHTLFVSDDTGTRSVYVVRAGGDGNLGTGDDQVTQINMGTYGASDTEDPEFDPVSGDLFVLSGTDREIFRIDPVDGVFGNGNDTVTSFDISHLGPTDFEGLTSSASRRTLFVGSRNTDQIFEITHDGTLLRTIEVGAISGLSFVSGLAMAPSTANPASKSLWIVDRGVDENNDGQVFEIAVSDLDEPVGNLAPVVDAGPDRSVVFPNTATLSGSVSDDGLPESGQLTQSWTKVSGPGTVTFANPASPATTAGFSEPGVYRLELSASDGELSASDDMLVTVDAPASQPPSVEPIDDVTVAEGETVVVPVSVSDPDGDDLTVSIDGLPGFGAFDDGNNELTFSPSTGDAGSYGPVTVTVADGDPQGGQAPVFRAAASAIITGASGSVLTISRPAGVQEGDLLLAQIRYRGSVPNLTPPAGWTVLATIPDSSQANHSILYKMAGASEPSSYAFNQNTDAGRIAGGIGAYVGVDTADPIDAWAASPADSSTLQAPSVASTVGNTRVVRLWGWRGPSADGVGFNLPPAGVTQRWSEQLGHSNNDRNRVLAGDQVQATAGPVGTATASGATGSRDRSSVTVVLAPGGSSGLTDSTTFNVTVTPSTSNQAPVATNDTATTASGTAVDVDVLANDTDGDGDSLSVVSLSDPANGSATVVAGGAVRYTPDDGFSGQDSFTYQASDGTAVSNVATVTVTVSAAPSGEAPTFRSSSTAILTSPNGSVLTIEKPAGVQAGDLLLAQIRFRGKTPNLTAPPGWTVIGTIPDSSHANHTILFKIAGASEPASYQFDQGVNEGRMSGGIGAYVGVDASNPIDAWAASNAKTNQLVAPDATSTVANTMVVRMWGWRGRSGAIGGYNVPPPGITERWSTQDGFDGQYTDRNRVLAGDHVQVTAGSVGEAVASGAGNNGEKNRSSFTVILRPGS